VASAGKHIERLVRRAFLSALRLRTRRRGDPRALSSLVSPGILLIRPDRIGDAIISVPVIRLLRERFPDARIDMLLGEKNRSAAPLLPGLDSTFVIPAAPLKLPGTLRRLRRRYDVAINLLAKDSASAGAITALAGARYSIGFEGAAGGLYDVTIPSPPGDMHIVRATSLLLAPLGISPIGEEPARHAERLSIAIPEELRTGTRGRIEALPGSGASPIVALNISGSGPEKFLGIDRYVQIARLLGEAGLMPVFAAAPGDAALLETIARKSGCSALPTTRSLAEFAAMLSHADLIVTPDTSIVHVAAALGRPTVMMVPSPATGTAWRPWGVPHALAVGDGVVASIRPADLATSIISLASATVGIAPTSSAS